MTRVALVRASGTSGPPTSPPARPKPTKVAMNPETRSEPANREHSASPLWRPRRRSPERNRRETSAEPAPTTSTAVLAQVASLAMRRLRNDPVWASPFQSLNPDSFAATVAGNESVGCRGLA